MDGASGRIGYDEGMKWAVGTISTLLILVNRDNDHSRTVGRCLVPKSFAKDDVLPWIGPQRR